MTEGICSRFQSAPKFAAFESPQTLRASVPTPFGPSGHFPLIGGIGPLCPRGAFWGGYGKQKRRIPVFLGMRRVCFSVGPGLFCGHDMALAEAGVLVLVLDNLRHIVAEHVPRRVLRPDQLHIRFASRVLFPIVYHSAP